MEIQIDEDVLRQAVVQSTHKAVEGALESYQIEKEIRDRVVDSVLGSAIAETCANAILDVDMDALRKALAAEMSRSVIRAATHLMREATIEVLLTMKGLPSYDDKGRKKARDEIERKILMAEKRDEQ